MEDSKNSSVHVAGSEVKPESRVMPCPFCGALPRLVDFAGWEIHCKCGISMCLVGPDKEPLVAAWNSRAHQSNPDLERDSARFQWVERNWHAGLHIDYFGPESERPGYFHTWLVDDCEVMYGEERYATYGEAVDAAIAREKAGTA